MFDLIKLIVSPLTGVIGKYQERKAQKQEAVAVMDRILVEASAADAAVAGQIALAKVESEKETWKDEAALLTICLPYWVAMWMALTGGDAEIVREMFANMAAIPEYWQETFKYAIWGALSIVGVKRLKP